MIDQIIKSTNNPIIKHVKQLKTKKTREKSNQYLVDGLRIVKHALEIKGCIEYLLVTAEYKDSIHFESIAQSLRDIKVYTIESKLMKVLVETESPQGIMAVVNKRDASNIDGAILILDRIQDPGNIGTLIRTADAAGFSTVMLAKGCTDPYGQKALRSSMGSIMNMNIVNSDNILHDVERLKSDGYFIYSAALENGESFRNVDYNEKKALVIGNEANGISDDMLNISNKRIYIPMIGDVESLNASIAGGILMFEMNK